MSRGYENFDLYSVHVAARDLTPALIGHSIMYDLDEPTIYGGQRPGPREGWLWVTLDGREVDGIPEDDVWITPNSAELISAR